MTTPDNILKSRDITWPTKFCLVKAVVFSSSHVWMWQLTIKKAECWKLDAFELWCWRRLESPLDCKEIQPVHPKGNQSWIFIGRTDVEGEARILWPLDVKNWLIGKDPDAGKDWMWEEKGVTGWDGWMPSPAQWTWVWVNSRSWWWDREVWHAAVHGVAKSWTWLRDWTELRKIIHMGADLTRTNEVRNSENTSLKCWRKKNVNPQLYI